MTLCFCAACSSEDDSDPDPAYCGTWTPTDDLITYLNNALSNATSSNTYSNETQAATLSDGDTNESESTGDQAASSIQLSTSDISLTINNNSTVTISVMSGSITIPGTYTYSGSDSSGTFEFSLDYSSLSDYGEQVSSMAQLIGSAFTGEGKSVTYTTGELSVTLGTNTDATVIFTK